jgi:hypothetical protein
VPQICHGWLSRHRQILDKLIFADFEQINLY